MKRESTAVVEEADRVIVLELTRPESRPLVLEGTAAAIWHRIDGARATDDIVRTLADELGISTDAIRSDVEDFLARLENELLLSGTTHLQEIL